MIIIQRFCPGLYSTLTRIITLSPTSNLKSAVEPLKTEEAKCNQIRIDNPEESKPPR